MPKLPCVLLADDDSITNYLNQRLLTRLGVAGELSVALNGEQALAMLRDYFGRHPTGGPVLVLLDVKMPVMGGLRFLDALEQLPQAEAVVTVILTTSLHPQDTAQLREHRIAGFLSKPLTAEKMQDLLSTHFPQ
ncbi:response regulator [Hymenobacter rubripertinctus]|uniref:Response regulator n=1 Tax=Hymenobacter rubripertinctus TaxID=2029981 RepID=A0A418R028_9BACT|nr:response regulator [Hymenobacter rubripertinctus]RIY10751.1 response regulator [Hymenobacter rubripertinctus]